MVLLERVMGCFVALYDARLVVEFVADPGSLTLYCALVVGNYRQ